jgi:hypothetical protein
MPVVKVPDDAGNTMTLLEVNGRYLPVLRTPDYDQEAEIRGMTSWAARSDDVLVCAYPKSGKMVFSLLSLFLPSNSSIYI